MKRPLPGTNWHGRSAMNLSLNSCPCFVREVVENPEADVALRFNSVCMSLRVCIGVGGGRGRAGKGSVPFHGLMFLFCS